MKIVLLWGSVVGHMKIYCSVIHLWESVCLMKTMHLQMGVGQSYENNLFVGVSRSYEDN